MTDLLRLQRSGKVRVKGAKTSHATTRSLELGFTDQYSLQGMKKAMELTLPQRQQEMT